LFVPDERELFPADSRLFARPLRPGRREQKLDFPHFCGPCSQLAAANGTTENPNTFFQKSRQSTGRHAYCYHYHCSRGRQGAMREHSMTETQFEIVLKRGIIADAVVFV
jgi:hypothetical protein